ncbi:MAG: hypothetical protein WBA77_01740 [Microcoleaceae cyanobacterium]
MLQKLLFILSRRLLIYGFILIGGYGIAGWLLAAFNAPLSIWLGSLFIILYLARSGQDGLLIANAWIVLIICLVTVFKRWPQIWPSQIPVNQIALWSTIIVLLWSLGIVLIVSLALTYKEMELRGFRAIQRFIILVSLTGLSLGGGGLFFSLSQL